MDYTTALLTGFALCFGISIGIGALNLHIFESCAQRNHCLVVVGVTILGDLFLISLGTLFVGQFVVEGHWVTTLMQIAAVVFIASYGALKIKSGLFPEACTVRPRVQKKATMSKAALVTLGFTLLNPHSLLDTLVIVGGSAGTFSPIFRPWFAAGAILGSSAWFCLLGAIGAFLGGKLLQDRVWQRVELGSGVLLIGIAVSLM